MQGVFYRGSAAHRAHGDEQIVVQANALLRAQRRGRSIGGKQIENDRALPRLRGKQFAQTIERKFIHHVARQIHANTQRAHSAGRAFENARFHHDQPRADFFGRHVLETDDGPLIAFARAHGPRADDDPGDRDLFAVAPALEQRQIDDTQVL